ncbi:hypothetical protein Tco_1105087 [Tanacetum coccineum]
MTTYPEISRRVHDKYRNFKNDDIVKSIFNSGKNKAGVGIKIPSWMITDEMKLMENYWMYTEAFGVEVPTNQSQPIESTQILYSTKMINPSYSNNTNLTAAEVEDMTVQDTIQLSIAEQKSSDDLEAEQNVEKVKEHLAAEELKKWLDPGSYKESPEVEIINVVQFVNVIEEEDESAEDDYESPGIHSTLIFLDTEKLQELTVTDPKPSSSTPSLSSPKPSSSIKPSYSLQPKIGRFKRSYVIHPRNHDNHHDDAHPEGENSAKRQKIYEHRTYVIGESSSRQPDESDPSPSTSGNQEQLDDFDFWTDKYATNDELPAEKVSQELVKEMSETIDEAKLRKIPAPVVQSCQRDPKAPALSLVDQGLLYLKKGNSRSKKYVLSLHKFHAVIFSNDDIEERTSRWNFYIKRQKELGMPIEEVYSNSKIVQVIKTTGELGHKHKFVIEIIVKRANGRFSSITEPDYKNLNKNDIEDMYLLCVNGKVDKNVEIGLLWSLSVFIRSTVIWERVHDF